MCLDLRQTKKETDKWLKTQPDIITAYKIVEKRKISDGEYKWLPIHCPGKTKEYKKKNRIRGDRPFVKPSATYRRPYKAYFHLWLKMPTSDMRNYEGLVIIECHVPKHLITAFGVDCEIPAIVSKGFDIIDITDY